jgi:hypothetical protein
VTGGLQGGLQGVARRKVDGGIVRTEADRRVEQHSAQGAYPRNSHAWSCGGVNSLTLPYLTLPYLRHLIDVVIAIFKYNDTFKKEKKIAKVILSP